MKNIANQLSDNKSCDEVVRLCHKLLDEAEIEHLPIYPEGQRLIERVKLVVMRLTLRDEALEETLKKLRELTDGEGGNGEQV